MSTLIDFAIFPLDKGTSLSGFVARAAAIIRDSGLSFSIGPMGTTIEGEWSAVMTVVDQCMTALQKDSDRIYCTIKVDYRRGQTGRMKQKVASLEYQMR